RRAVQPAARPPDRTAHPDRPGRPAADPGDRDKPSADHQADHGPGPAAGTAQRGPRPPALTPNTAATEGDLYRCANYPASSEFPAGGAAPKPPRRSAWSGR